MQPEAGNRLPIPDDVALRHSERAARHIAQRIERAGGRISFGEFMHDALYAPGYGYYVSGAEKFGRDGDFVTAPEVSPLFGRVVARQCAEVFATLDDPAVLELGAGSGVLAADVLERLGECGALPRRYQILEISAELRDRQRQRLGPVAQRLNVEIEWLDGLPDAFRGVILANEVADALPVERFRRGASGVEQGFVELGDGGEFRAAWAPPRGALEAAVDEIEEDLQTRLADGYRSEVSLGLPEWVRSVAGALEEGLILFFDYGLTRREYYAPDRSGGWLRCHFRHRAHDEALIYPGIQDITAWVDFSAVARAAADAGLEVAGFVTQAMFLLNGGLDNEFMAFNTLPTAEQMALTQQVKRLTLPTEMGENFKCMGLSSAGGFSPSAFAQSDRAERL